MSKEGKQRYSRLRAKVLEAINRADPIGLLGMGAPGDEYEPEVGTVLPRLRNATSADDVEQILHEEFSRWFGPDQAGPRDVYHQPAGEIWRVLESVDPA